jgi:hypothetical protein
MQPPGRITTLHTADNSSIERGILGRSVSLYVASYRRATCVFHPKEGKQDGGTENSVLGETFGTKKGEVVIGWGKLHKEEVHKLAAWQNGNHIKENEVGGARSTQGNDEKYVHKCSYIIKVKDLSGDQNVDGEILKYIVKE